MSWSRCVKVVCIQEHIFTPDQVAPLGISAHARVLNRLIARDAHIEAGMGQAAHSPRPSPSLRQSSAHAPSRFELRQAALRSSTSLSSSRSTGMSLFDSQGASSIGVGNSIGVSPQPRQLLHSTSRTPAAPHPPTEAYRSDTQHPDDNCQPPPPLERTGAAILRAASTSTVRPHVFGCCLLLDVSLPFSRS